MSVNMYQYPEWDEFYLLVCDICSQVLKPQALDNHIKTKHKAHVEKISSIKEVKINNTQNQQPRQQPLQQQQPIQKNVIQTQKPYQWGGEASLQFHPRPAVICPFDQNILRNRRLSYKRLLICEKPNQLNHKP